LGIEEDGKKQRGEGGMINGINDGALSTLADDFLGFLKACGWRMVLSSPRSNAARLLCRYANCCKLNCIMAST